MVDDTYTVDEELRPIIRSWFCPKIVCTGKRNHGVTKSEIKETEEFENRKVRQSRLPLYTERASKRINLFQGGNNAKTLLQNPDF